MPSAIPFSLSPLISRIHSCLFSDWRRTVLSKFFDTQAPSISTEELVLLRHAHYVLSRLRCNGHSLLSSSIFLGLAESRILHATPAVIHPRTPLIIFCIVQLRTHCSARSLATLCLSTTSGPDPGQLLGFWASMVFPRKGSSSNNNNSWRQTNLTKEKPAKIQAILKQPLVPDKTITFIKGKVERQKLRFLHCKTCNKQNVFYITIFYYSCCLSQCKRHLKTAKQNTTDEKKMYHLA